MNLLALSAVGPATSAGVDPSKERLVTDSTGPTTGPPGSPVTRRPV